MIAIFKRELKSYFYSPIGYVCVAAIVALYGFFYYAILMSSGTTAYIGSVYSTLFSFTMIILPILTMRSMSEDQKNKTDQALLTAPVSVVSIVTGKFFASFAVYFVASTLGLLPAFALAFVSSPPWGIIFGNYIATLLYGGAMISIGVFISSLTQSQVIAAVGTFIASIIFMYIDGIAASINNPIVTKIVGWISFSTRNATFTAGTFSFASCIFFISVISIFVFLTSRRLESRRWS
ncbi:ABC transporter permease [Scatolibacter rhodanostii]|uniref:ABC transporter permease n=1 Tax=Scatolibacter rhodanostii TaxID=2014781 RepID=UPI000C079C60|nr:ABC transporter permease [Scatolibacter rhodanostii]